MVSIAVASAFSDSSLRRARDTSSFRASSSRLRRQ
jgi:hypothetical protein